MKQVLSIVKQVIVNCKVSLKSTVSRYCTKHDVLRLKPSFNGFHHRSIHKENPKSKRNLPGWMPSKPLKNWHLSSRSFRNMAKRKSTWIVNHHKASRECLMHTTEATFAFKTQTKVPLANTTSSPLLLWLRQLAQSNLQRHDNRHLFISPLQYSK